MWVEKFTPLCSDDDVVLTLVGNCADMEESRMVTVSEGRSLAQRYGMSFMEISAKEGWGIAELFQSVGERILAKVCYESCLLRIPTVCPVVAVMARF